MKIREEYSSTLDLIKNQVEDLLRVKISGSGRHRKIVTARCIYTKLALNHTRLTLKEIGEGIGKDHATIIHYSKVFDARMNGDVSAFELYEKLNEEMAVSFYFTEANEEEDEPKERTMEERKALEIYKKMKGIKAERKKNTLTAIDLLIDNSAQNPYAFEHYKKVRAVAEKF